MAGMKIFSSSRVVSPAHVPRRTTAQAAAQKSTIKTTSATRKGSTVVFPLGEPGPRRVTSSNGPPVKLLTNVEKLRLLSKAEKAGLLSASEKLGLSLSVVERLGLLSKAEEVGLLSAATDPATPSLLLNLSLLLLLLGPSVAFLVPEDYPWEVVLQITVTLVAVVGGSATFAAWSFVSILQKSG